MTAPLQIGIYKSRHLIKSYICQEKTSDILPHIFKKIDKKYDIKHLYYAKGPGSFMAIKISYIFLKSYAIVKNIPLMAVDGFYFNGNSPIKSIGKIYFVKEEDNIILDKINKREIKSFELPKVIKENDFSLDSTPLYILPAV